MPPGSRRPEPTALGRSRAIPGPCVLPSLVLNPFALLRLLRILSTVNSPLVRLGRLRLKLPMLQEGEQKQGSFPSRSLPLRRSSPRSARGTPPSSYRRLGAHIRRDVCDAASAPHQLLPSPFNRVVAVKVLSLMIVGGLSVRATPKSSRAKDGSQCHHLMLCYEQPSARPLVSTVYDVLSSSILFDLCHDSFLDFLLFP